MTGRMLEGIEQILLEEKPDWVLIYGDTNSTLAGALAAAKLHIPVAHVEAGLRSFNMRMPEEVNRILVDCVSTLLLCPTTIAVENLAREGVTQGVQNVGDVMYDVALYYRERARTTSQILSTLGLCEKGFSLATCHRAENTDAPERLAEILSALATIAVDLPVVFPLHPRTRKVINDHNLKHWLKELIVVEPLPFLDMVALEQAAKVILTDSGGVQKEAFFYEVPCITMRDETEWVETVALGWNHVVGASKARILEVYFSLSSGDMDEKSAPYGSGFASRLILEELMKEA
jgi:UDP-GlcNAc3NAcA epimerase